FAEICERMEIAFIGPTAEQIRLMGDKAVARRNMAAAGVPTVPGSPGAVPDADAALAMAREIGFPVLVKAASGGGGKGMRVAPDEASFMTMFTMAQNEAAAAFGDASVYLEKYLGRPRHIEIQLLGDKHGHAIYLGERECSIQRRHQKLIEESPSVAVNAALRRKMGEAAVKGASSIGYQSAGTIEFLLDEDGRFYFMEMNTRIQVEHPVTELVTGIDLVKEQIRIAAGEPIGITQDEVELRGHSIECRINAEDPARNFAPSPGVISIFHPPGGPGVRLDTHVYAGYRVPSQYDSLVAKLIVHAHTRDEALARMRLALDSFIIEGIHTTIPFLRELLDNPAFIAGDIDTKFVDRLMAERAGQRDGAQAAGGAAAARPGRAAVA
ncbi:MAG TPA: carbamoyl phosphate synthase, partial [Longimicrobiales bacterium]